MQMHKTRPQCGILIDNGAGRVLLQLRDDSAGIPYPNSWGTFGGQVEDGETPLQAIIRELREELDYSCGAPEQYGVYWFDGYAIHMFRVIDPDLDPDVLHVREGQRAAFISRETLKHIPCAFNCRAIVEDYFTKFPPRYV
jgi:8-oxo-dGTP diphosphatase